MLGVIQFNALERPFNYRIKFERVQLSCLVNCTRSKILIR
jgi:hypothetical protein